MHCRDDWSDISRRCGSKHLDDKHCSRKGRGAQRQQKEEWSKTETTGKAIGLPIFSLSHGFRSSFHGLIVMVSSMWSPLMMFLFSYSECAGEIWWQKSWEHCNCKDCTSAPKVCFMHRGRIALECNCKIPLLQSSGFALNHNQTTESANCFKGRLDYKIWMNFRKTSKRGVFPIQKLCCRF